MTPVFISYSRRDQPFVRQLAARLKAAGRESWVDWEGIPPSAKWMDEIRAAIDGASAMVFVISPDSLASAVCAQELEHALAVNKRLIPVVARPASPVPPALAELNWVNFAAGDEAAALDALLLALDRDPAWVREHTRVLVRAREWQRAERESGYLLRGKDLAGAEQWLASASQHPEPKPTELHTEYVLQSRAAQARLQRNRIWAAAVAVVVSLLLAVWALAERGTARSNEAEANLQRQQAEGNQREAVRQQALAVANAASAVAQERVANANAVQAEQRRVEAEHQAALARAGELAAQANLALGTDPDQAMRVALAALAVSATPQGERVLREAVRTSSAVAVLGGDCNVASAEFGPQGRHVLALCMDDSWRVWHAGTARELLRLPAGPQRATLAQWGGQESVLFVAGADGAVQALAVPGGRPLARIAPLPGAGVGALLFNPRRGQLLVWRQGDGLRAYGTESLQRLGRLDEAWHSQQPAGGLRWLRNSDDGSELAALWPDPALAGMASVRYFDAASGRPLPGLGGQPEIFPRGSVFDREGRQMLRLGDDEISEHWNAVTWDLRAGKQVASLNRPAGRFYAGAIDAAGRAFIGYRGNVVQVWLPARDGGDRQPWIELSGHTGRVIDIAVQGGEGDTRVLTASEDGSARLWRLSENADRELRVLRGHRGTVTMARFAPDGSQALTVGLDGTARVWRLTANDLGPPLDDPVLRLAANPAQDGSVRALPADEGLQRLLQQQGSRLQWLDRASGRSLCEMDAAALHLGTPRVFLAAGAQRALLLHPGGGSGALLDLRACRVVQRYAGLGATAPMEVVFNTDATAAILRTDAQRVLGLSTGQPLGTLLGAQHIFTPAAFLPDGRGVLALDVWGEHLVHWGGPPYGKGEVWSLPLKIKDFVLDKAGRALAAHDGAAQVLLFDPLARRVLHQWPFAAAALAFSDDGRWLAARHIDGGLRVWGTQDGRAALSLPPGSDASSGALRFNSDGRRLQSDGGVWAIDGGQRLDVPAAEATPWADGLLFRVEAWQGLKTTYSVHRCLPCEPLPALLATARQRLAARSAGLPP